MNDKDKVVERLVGTEKDCWCPKCKCFPDKILEKVVLIEGRRWDKDMKSYVLDEDGRQEDKFIWAKCLDCETELEDKDDSN